MIQDDFKVRGKFQIESKFSYLLDRKEEKSSYDIETYFFLPSTLGITKENYKRFNFFSNIHTYLKLETPAYSLKEIAAGKSSPLLKVKHSLLELKAKNSKAAQNKYKAHLKVFCCVMRYALSYEARQIISLRKLHEKEKKIDEFLMHIRRIQFLFSEVKDIAASQDLDDKLRSKILFSDEYLSLIIERTCFFLVEGLEARSEEGLKDKVSALLHFAKEQVDYRASNNYPSIPKEDSGNDKFIFRMNILKKFNARIFYLSTRKSSDTKVYSQVAASVAAGIAMVFATAAAFYFQQKYGNLTFPFFIALVTSYIFKDRIKDLTKHYFDTRMHRFFFDSKTYIYDSASENIGTMNEAFHFIPDQKIPAMIHEMRNHNHVTEIESEWLEENIMVHRKRIVLKPRRMNHDFEEYDIDTIMDITRFNISRFSKNTDSPKKAVYLTDGKSYRKVPGDRHYHLNVIIRFREGKNLVFKRLRIIFNRTGIKRVENVFTAKGTVDKQTELMDYIHKMLEETVKKITEKTEYMARFPSNIKMRRISHK